MCGGQFGGYDPFILVPKIDLIEYFFYVFCQSRKCLNICFGLFLIRHMNEAA